MSRRMLACGEWMRAMSCGVTSSQVSIGTLAKPSWIAALTSAFWPLRNQSVRRRSVSWSEDEGAERAMERKKASIEGTRWPEYMSGGRTMSCRAPSGQVDLT